MNFITFTFAGTADLDRVIDEQLEYFMSQGQSLTWKVWDHDQRADLEHKLTEIGFVRDDDDPGQVMVLDMQDVPAPLLEPVQADIRRISDAAGLGDVIRVLDEVYGNENSWVRDRLGGHLQIPGYLSVYAAYMEDRPAAVAWTYFPSGHFATLFAGTTLEGYRKRGLYTSLLAVRLQEIRARGRRYAIVDAGAMSRPIVEKHGFRYLTTQHDYEWNGVLEAGSLANAE